MIFLKSNVKGYLSYSQFAWYQGILIDNFNVNIGYHTKGIMKMPEVEVTFPMNRMRLGKQIYCNMQMSFLTAFFLKMYHLYS